ncbi:MAG: energy transducer TonB [Blastocatellia bacterium]|nr:energy transducer TonB [Blastocatellia bacterium]
MLIPGEMGAAGSQTEVSPLATDPVICKEAQKLFEADWLRVQDSLVAKSQDGKNFIQIIDLEITAYKFGTLTRADQLNGIDWKGYVQCKWAAHRFWFRDYGWTEWKDGAVLERDLMRKKGAWVFPAPVTWDSFFRGLDHQITLQRPASNEVSAIAKDPTMPSERERSLLTSIGPGSGVENLRVPVILPPKIISQVKPKYTVEARENKIQGTVVLSVEFRADGTVGDIRVIRGLGFGLDEKAVEAARLTRFRPAVQNGKPVPWRGKVEFSFDLL